MFPSGSSILINIIETPDAEVLLNENGYDLISRKKSGRGSVFFVSFDYTGILRNWNGLDSIWNDVFDSVWKNDIFQEKMASEFSMEKFIEIFDSSGFSHIDKKSIFLILLLSSSTSVSMLVFIRIRRKSRFITYYIFALIFILFLLAAYIFATLFNNNFRTDSSVVSINIFDHSYNSNRALLYKDILIGSANQTETDLIIRDDTRSIIFQDNYENLNILNTPELTIPELNMEQWSYRVLRLKSSVSSLISQNISDQNDYLLLNIRNISDYYIQDSFVIYNNNLYTTGSLLADSSLSVKLSKKEPENDKIPQFSFNKNELLNTAAHYYINMTEEPDKENIIFAGFINDEIYPLEFSKKTWKKKRANLILFRYSLNGDNE